MTQGSWANRDHGAVGAEAQAVAAAPPTWRDGVADAAGHPAMATGLGVVLLLVLVLVWRALRRGVSPRRSR
jgi:hypothetical protein